jgi:hypothetical protein
MQEQKQGINSNNHCAKVKDRKLTVCSIKTDPVHTEGEGNYVMDAII